MYLVGGRGTSCVDMGFYFVGEGTSCVDVINGDWNLNCESFKANLLFISYLAEN